MDIRLVEIEGRNRQIMYYEIMQKRNEKGNYINSSFNRSINIWNYVIVHDGKTYFAIKNVYHLDREDFDYLAIVDVKED